MDLYDAWRNLALSIIRQAIQDSCDGDTRAAAWLLDDGRQLLDWCGFVVSKDRLTRVTMRTWRENKAVYRQSRRQEAL